MSLESRSLTLKPCPFCGGTPVFRTGDAEGIPSGHFLECDGCHASTALVFPLKDDVTRELAERWNKRAPVSETGPSVTDERLKELAMQIWKERGWYSAADGDDPGTVEWRLLLAGIKAGLSERGG